MATDRTTPRCPATVAAVKPGSCSVSTSASVSPSRSPAGAQPEPSTRATSWRAVPVSSARRSAAVRATSNGSVAGSARSGVVVIGGTIAGRRSMSAVGAAGSATQVGDVVVRRPGGLGGVGQLAEVAGRRQAALVAVHDVDPGQRLAVQGVDPHADLAVDAEPG